jgi:hypothetical protein
MPLVAGKSNKGNGIFSTMFDQKRDVTRASFAGGRAISMLVLAATLAACAMPGMRMQELPTLPADGASNTTDTHDVTVPISAIDMALIRNMHDQAMQDRSATGADLFAAPGAYTLGAGDVLQIVVWDHPELAAALGAQTQAQARPSDAPTGFVRERQGLSPLRGVRRHRPLPERSRDLRSIPSTDRAGRRALARSPGQARILK